MRGSSVSRAECSLMRGGEKIASGQIGELPLVEEAIPDNFHLCGYCSATVLVNEPLEVLLINVLLPLDTTAPGPIAYTAVLQFPSVLPLNWITPP